MSEHELWNELGNLYFLSGSYGQAVHAYRRSIQMDDCFGRPYSNLALTYVQQGKFDEAVDLYRRSIELLVENNEKAISWNRLGNVYRYLKDYSSALMAYQRADELDPESGESEERPGWVSETSTKAAPDREVDIVFPDDTPQPVEAETAVALAEPSTPQPVEVETTVALAEPPTPPLVEAETAVALAEPSTPQLVEVETAVALAEPSAPEEAADQSEIAPDNVVASWALTELNPYQQSVSASPAPDPLTTWGTPSFDEPAEPFAAPDADADIQVPDGDDDLTKWLPLPEQAPQDSLQAAPEPEEPIEEVVEEPVESVDLPTPVLPIENPVERVEPFAPAPDVIYLPATVPAIVYPREITDQLEEVQPVPETEVAVEVEVEERTAPEMVFAVSQSVEAVTEMQAAKDEPPVEIEASADSAEVEACANAAEETVEPELAAVIERTADEMQKMQSDITKYRRVVQVNPRNAHAWDTLGNLYKSAGQYSESLTAYQQAVGTDPGRALYHHHLGLLYACLGRTEDAICAFQRVIEIDPNHSLAHATLGGYYRKMGLEELAQKHIGKAMKSIFDSENEYNRACLAAICGNADEALELLRVALRNKQTYVDWILRDPDLDFIRQDPRFRQLISDYTR